MIGVLLILGTIPLVLLFPTLPTSSYTAAPEVILLSGILIAAPYYLAAFYLYVFRIDKIFSRDGGQ